MTIQLLDINTKPALMDDTVKEPTVILNTTRRTCHVRPFEPSDLRDDRFLPNDHLMFFIPSVDEKQLEKYFQSPEFSAIFNRLSDDEESNDELIREIQESIRDLEPSKWQITTAKDFAYEQLELAENPIDFALLKNIEAWLEDPRSSYLILTTSEGSELETSWALLRALKGDLPTSLTYDEVRTALEPCLLSDIDKVKNRGAAAPRLSSAEVAKSRFEAKTFKVTPVRFWLMSNEASQPSKP